VRLRGQKGQVGREVTAYQMGWIGGSDRRCGPQACGAALESVRGNMGPCLLEIRS
jgi:hypothetical protein